MKLTGECPGPGREAGVAEGWEGPQALQWTAGLLSPPPHLLSALQLLLWHSALWMVQEAAPLGPTGPLPQSFLLKCLEQMRKVQADGTALQETLVRESTGGDLGAGRGYPERTAEGRHKGEELRVGKGMERRYDQGGMWERRDPREREET